MTTAPPIRTDVIDAVVTMLAAATLKPAWGPDGPDPTVDASSLLPYLVVEPAAGGAAMGSVGAPEDTAEIVVQVTAVGETVTSALIAMDAARTALLERDGTGDGFSNPITAPHMYVMARAWDSDGGTIVEAGIVNVVERFRLTVVAPPIERDGIDGGDPDDDYPWLDGGIPSPEPGDPDYDGGDPTPEPVGNIEGGDPTPEPTEFDGGAPTIESDRDAVDGGIG